MRPRGRRLREAAAATAVTTRRDGCDSSIAPGRNEVRFEDPADIDARRVAGFRKKLGLASAAVGQRGHAEFCADAVGGGPEMRFFFQELDDGGGGDIEVDGDRGGISAKGMEEVEDE